MNNAKDQIAFNNIFFKIYNTNKLKVNLKEGINMLLWAVRTVMFWMVQALLMAYFIVSLDEGPDKSAFRVIFVTTIMVIAYILMEVFFWKSIK